MIPKEKIKELVFKYENIEKELSSGKIDPKLYAGMSKEYSDLGSIIQNAREFLKFDNDKIELEKILNDKNNDKEMLLLAEKELQELKGKKEINEGKLKIFLLPKDEDDKKNAIVEIRAGTGGLEATLFCSDLFKMYEKVCSKKNGKWK